MPNVYSNEELKDIEGCLGVDYRTPSRTHFISWWRSNGRSLLKEHKPDLYRAMLCEFNDLMLYAASPDPDARAVVEWRIRRNR